MSQSSALNVLQNQLAKRSDIHLLRKLWHISTGGSALWIYYNILPERKLWAYVSLAIALMGFTLDLMRMKNKALNELVVKLMGPLMRKSESTGFSGLPFYALGISLSLFLFKEKIALLAITFLVFSDPISSFFGVRYGKDKILPNKSLQGSLAGFCTCYLITLFSVIGVGASPLAILSFSLLCGVIGSVSELVSAYNIDDNLTIPVLSGLGITLLNYIFKIF
jgi:dolichol kinase